jgi:thiamine biosynthesis lipoprotein
MKILKSRNLWIGSLTVGIFVLGSYFHFDRRPIVFFEGKALGVVYTVVYQGDLDIRSSLDSMINAYDMALNTERPDAEISLFNRNGRLKFRSPILYQTIKVSEAISANYGQVANHMVFALIQAWGKDFSNKWEMTDEKIAALKQLCNPHALHLTPDFMEAKIDGVKIGLSYMDKGYLIDQMAAFLLSKDIQNFQIEFGTDSIYKGKGMPNKNQKQVMIQQEGQKEPPTSFKGILLENRAYSSSGSFERFYVDEEGSKHSHIIDPRTGRPINNKMLSTHIVAPTCLEADALATIFMVLGLEASTKIIMTNPDLEGLIIYNEMGKIKTWRSPGFKTIGITGN